MSIFKSVTLTCYHVRFLVEWKRKVHLIKILYRLKAYTCVCIDKAHLTLGNIICFRKVSLCALIKSRRKCHTTHHPILKKSVTRHYGNTRTSYIPNKNRIFNSDKLSLSSEQILMEDITLNPCMLNTSPS